MSARLCGVAQNKAWALYGIGLYPLLATENDINDPHLNECSPVRIPKKKPEHLVQEVFFSGEIGVFAMAPLVPKDEPTWQEDHTEDDQHEQQDE